MTRFGEVLKEARLELNLTQLEVANRIGRTQAYYNRIENGKVPPPSFDILERLAKILKHDLSKLRDLAGQSRLVFKQKQIEQQRKALGIKTSGSSIPPIAILSKIPAGYPKNYNGFPSEIVEEYYQFNIEEQDPDAFLLRVEGDCMAPYILKGDLLLIAPNEEVGSGDIAVVVNGKGEGEITRVTIHKDGIILTPDNPAYPTIVWEAKDKPKIIGRVKEIIRRR